MRIFYLYYLRRPDKIDPLDPSRGQPFYAGKGSNCRIKGHRKEAEKLLHKPGRKQYKISIIHSLWKQGLDFEEDIYLDDLSEEDAFALEMAAIEQYGRKDNGTGILANLTDGGEGKFGYHISDETKLKMKLAHLGEKHYQYGKHWSDSRRQEFIKTLSKKRKQKEEAMDINQLFKPRPRSTHTNTPHPLKLFFRARGISQIAICKLLNLPGLHQSSLSMWLSGKEPIPKRFEEKLQELSDEIIKSENN